MTLAPIDQLSPIEKLPTTIIFNAVPFPQKADWPDWIVALFTIGLFLVAWWQLGKIRKTGYADFAHRLNADFYTDECDEILKHIVKADFSFYPAGNLAEFRDSNGLLLFEDAQLDRHVLGPLEAVGIFQKRKFLDLDFVYDMFGTAIIEVMQNAEILRYIKWAQQRPHSNDLYCCLLFLNSACLDYTRAKGQGRKAMLKYKLRFLIQSWFVSR